DIIAIDLFVQCKILEKHKNVVYNDEAIIYFRTPLTRADFFSQITRAIIGHKQIKKYTQKFSPRMPFFILLKEFIKNSFLYPNYSWALIYCYTMLPFSYFKNRKNVSYLWKTATSTKE
nr:hypothetical protein [Nitrosopumilus sp.]